MIDCIRAGWESRWRRRAILAAYGAVVGMFFWTLMLLWTPGRGFSQLIEFGGRLGLPRVHQLEATDYYLQRHGYGYDAQFYAQVAMNPMLHNPELATALDSPAYRARRILFGWTAYALGLGRPEWVLEAYATQNIIAWLLLAAVLLWWFPATSWGNFFRWVGVLGAVGLAASLRYALIDGPSLLLVALGVRAVERGRPWLATAVFAVSGLGKETNWLGAAALVGPETRTWRGLGRLVLQAVLVVGPLALWMLYVNDALGPALEAGIRNFNAPLLSYFTKWRHTWWGLVQSNWGDENVRSSFYLLIALTVQVVFLAVRPRPSAAWWRVGASFAVLTVVVGSSVWEGHPGAVSRVLLPMQLAFNVLVPRGRRWWPVLVLGNLTILGSPASLPPPAGDGYTMRGETALMLSENLTNHAQVAFGDEWFDPERRGRRYWRWAQGDAAFVLTNPQTRPIAARLSFYLDGVDQREATVTVGGREVWRGPIGVKGQEAHVELAGLSLAPGATTVAITTDRPSKAPVQPEFRPLAFSMRNLVIELSEPAK